MSKMFMPLCNNCVKNCQDEKIQIRRVRFSKYNNRKTNSPTNMNCCVDHNRKIAGLNNQISIALSHKSRLEKELAIIKNSMLYKNNEFISTQQHLEAEIENLRAGNLKKNKELDELKHFYLEEKKDLNNQINDLQTQLQHLTHGKNLIHQEYQQEKNILEHTIHTNAVTLEKEIEKNCNLQLKVCKYKTKLRSFVSYIQNLLQQHHKEINNKRPVADNPNKEIITKKEYASNMGTNFDDLILNELFFSPSHHMTFEEKHAFNHPQILE